MTLPGMYILDDEGNPVLATDLMQWGRWLETTTSRQLALTDVPGGLQVSTVFLALDHNFWPGGPPVLWETMVFEVRPVEGERHRHSLDYQQRYTSRGAALAGHAEAVRLFTESAQAALKKLDEPA